MPRKSVSVSFRFAEHILEAIDDLAQRLNVSRQKLMDEAAIRILEKYDGFQDDRTPPPGDFR